MVEHRRSRRIPVVQNVIYSFHASPRLARALSKDLNKKGVCILGQDRLNKGTPLNLEITLSEPTARLVRTEGQVIWQAEWPFSQNGSFRYLTGIQFANIAPTYRGRLDQWISSQQLQEYVKERRRDIDQELIHRVQSTAASFPVQMSLLIKPPAKIVATARCLPHQVVTNDDVLKMGLQSTDAMIRRALGAVKRRAASPAISNGDLMANVATQILEETTCHPTQIDRIICSADPQDVAAPNVASMVQRHIGATCPALDLQMSCAGWLCGIDLAARCISTGEKRILVLASSQVGSRITFNNLMHRAIFGDGAGGTLLEGSDHGNILSIGLWTSGLYYDKIYTPHPWSKLPESIPPAYANSFYMSSNQEDFFTTMDFHLLPFCERLWESAGISKNQIDHFLLHQPSIPLFEYSLRVLNVPREKTFNFFAEYGNLVSAEMPVYLDEGIRNGRIKRGDIVFLLAYGAGFTMGGMVLKY